MCDIIYTWLNFLSQSIPILILFVRAERASNILGLQIAMLVFCEPLCNEKYHSLSFFTSFNSTDYGQHQIKILFIQTCINWYINNIQLFYTIKYILFNFGKTVENIFANLYHKANSRNPINSVQPEVVGQGKNFKMKGIQEMNVGRYHLHTDLREAGLE